MGGVGFSWEAASVIVYCLLVAARGNHDGGVVRKLQTGGFPAQGKWAWDSTHQTVQSPKERIIELRTKLTQRPRKLPNMELQNGAYCLSRSPEIGQDVLAQERGLRWIGGGWIGGGWWVGDRILSRPNGRLKMETGVGEQVLQTSQLSMLEIVFHQRQKHLQLST